MKQVTVTVPATTANLGPGFDCLGLALNLHNTVTFRPVEQGLKISVAGEGAEAIPTDESNLVYRAAQQLFQVVGRKPAGLIIEQNNCVPASSGLGSSASAVVAGLAGANALINAGFSQSALLDMAAEMEGHADNVAPAFLGGLVLCNSLNQPGEPGQFHTEQIPTPVYHVVLVLPDVALLTRDARALLPNQVSRADAIFNISRMGLLIRALMAGDFAKLALAMQDRLHQPYRMPLIPGFQAAVRAAQSHGAVATALSGAGPSLIAFSQDNHRPIADDVQAAFAAAGISSRSWILTSDNNGCRVQIQ